MGIGIKGRPAPLIWEDAEEATIDKHSFYLVKTNGDEWNDTDLMVLYGMQITGKLSKNFTRGRPIWIAKYIPAEK